MLANSCAEVVRGPGAVKRTASSPTATIGVFRNPFPGGFTSNSSAVKILSVAATLSCRSSGMAQLELALAPIHCCRHRIWRSDLDTRRPAKPRESSSLLNRSHWNTNSGRREVQRYLLCRIDGGGGCVDLMDQISIVSLAGHVCLVPKRKSPRCGEARAKADTLPGSIIGPESWIPASIVLVARDVHSSVETSPTPNVTPSMLPDAHPGRSRYPPSSPKSWDNRSHSQPPRTCGSLMATL